RAGRGATAPPAGAEGVPSRPKRARVPLAFDTPPPGVRVDARYLMNTDPSAVQVANLAYVEELFESFRRDPGSVGPEWRAYFESGGNGDSWPDRPGLGPSRAPR